MFDSNPLQAALTARQEATRWQAVELEEIGNYVAQHPGEDGMPYDEFAHLEVAAVFGMSETAARARLDLARALTTRLPRTLAALKAGAIDEYRARRIAEATALLDDSLVVVVEDQIVHQAADLAPARLNRLLRRLIDHLDPDAAAARAQARSQARRVTHWGVEDGAGILQVQGDVERTQLAHDRVRALARQLKAAPGETRTFEQISSDVALDLLAGKRFEHARVHVWLTLPATTALGVDNAAGELAGYGPIPAHRALELAAQSDATWQRVLTDPATGRVLDVGRKKYVPPAALRDHIRATYLTCTGPGCTRPAHQCDQDHATPFPAGPTSEENLHPACRPHHRAKTIGGWRARKNTDGTVTWTTRAGFRITHHPEPITFPQNLKPKQDPDSRPEASAA